MPNYSFETNTACPKLTGHLIYATPWEVVNGQTPDYYHPCGQPGLYSSPNNMLNYGYQVASHGNCYAGFKAWDNAAGPSAREYIGVKLDTPMIDCRAYWISFKVCRANKSAWATDDIGLFIYGWSPPGTGALTGYNPQIINKPGNIVSDTLNWTIISGTYIASGNEQFITIGNFKSYDSTTVVGSGLGAAYYYVDEVRVEEFTPQFTLGPDIAACEGTPVVLEVDPLWDFVGWSTGSIVDTTHVTVSGEYHVIVYEGFCNFRDTINVTFDPSPQTEIGNDTTLCAGETLVLTANSPGNYTWSTGENASSVSITTSGNYWLQIDTGACSIRDELTANFADCFFMPDIFSPNNDGKNDVLYIRGMEGREFYFSVYDRWGQMVFESTSSSVGWDGNFKGQPLSAGVYVYYLVSVSPFTGESYSLKGNITLTR